MSGDTTRVRALLSAHDPAAGVETVPERVIGEVAAGRADAPVTVVRAGRRLALRAGFGLALAGVAAGVVLGAGGEESPRSTGAEAAPWDGDLPARTGTDWVTYADWVAVVRATEDEEIPPTREEIERGYISRSAKLTVDRVLWSRPAAEGRAPVHFTVDAAGWTVEGTERKEFVRPGEPRLETGHTYIVALARGAEGSWGPIGDGAVLPYDGAVIGEGESGGERVTAAAVTAPEGSVERRVAGKDARALVELLEAADPDPAAAPFASLPPEERFARSGRK
ncbi:hypothetical protein [Streptomyces sp. NPDC014894]|uniref:hypothetical protein n=1 Tax=Streptomyces sp. NPDC014894 TaxID=3364931 RepID=UPI0037025DB4